MPSMRSATSLDDARDKLMSRITAYSRAHDILLQKQWLSATLKNVVETATAAVGWEDSYRIQWNGPTVTLGPEAALSFSMTLHELLTNACKYGALSNDIGRVDVDWVIEGYEDGEHLLISWRETGGPEVSAPTQNGFRSRLISSTLRTYGNPVISFEPSGLALDIDMPLSKVEFREDLARIEASG